MTEQSERYDSGDDLEFDEFLENITDKYESITEQSNSNEKERINNWFCIVVEERKERSRQRWKQTTNEIDEQKRLLKARLEKRIQLVSESLKKPTVIKMRDKIAFTIGVANTCFSPLVGMKFIYIY